MQAERAGVHHASWFQEQNGHIASYTIPPKTHGHVDLNINLV